MKYFTDCLCLISPSLPEKPISGLNKTILEEPVAVLEVCGTG